MATGPDILIIDDDRDLVNSVRIILESQNYNVRTSHNGQDGYQKIIDKTPALIVLDVMMATDTEGFDLAFKLNRHPEYSKIPILMITGFPEKMAKQGIEGFQHIMGESWPVAQFLEKPVDPVKLITEVKSLLAMAAP